MKVIPKFQEGGFMSLFTQYTPVQTPTETPQRVSRSSQEKEEKENDKITEKDLLEMVSKIDGLPNDMQQVVSNLQQMFEMQAFGMGSISNLANTYLSNILSLKTAAFNKKEYDSAFTKSSQNGSLNEYAITETGKVVVQDSEGAIKFVDIKDLKDSEEYTPLTNSNLLYIRAHFPGYANQNTLLSIVNNGISLETVHNMIKSRFNQIGKSETSMDYYVSKEVIKGKDIIGNMLANGPDGYYKITEDLTTADKTALNAALNYIYNTLPRNAKTRLAIEAKDDSKEAILNIIQDALLGTIDSKNSTTIKYLGSENKLESDSDTSANSSEINKLNMNTAFKWLAGYGEKTAFTFNAGDNRYVFSATNSMPLVKMNGDYLGANSTLADVTTGQYGSLLDFSNATMGNNLIDPSALSQIVLTDGKIYSIDYPSIESNGYIRPNFSNETKERKDKADAEIESLGISLDNREQIKANYGLINSIYQKNELPAPYDADGNLKNGWHRFGVMRARASNRALGMDDFANNPLLQEVLDDASVDSYVSTVKDENFEKKGMFGIFGYDHVYQGTVWIPVSVNYNNALANQKISADTAMQLDMLDQARETTSKLILGRQPQ